MKIKEIQLRNIKCFTKEDIELSAKINVLVGKNNSGKSTVARASLMIQIGYSYSSQDRRAGGGNSEVKIFFSEVDAYFPSDTTGMAFKITNAVDKTLLQSGGTSSPAKLLAQREPHNFIYPYLSNRKVESFDETVTTDRTTAVSGDLRNLYAKVDRLSNIGMRAHDYYIEACTQFFGFPITGFDSAGGKKACHSIDDFNRIALDKMGDGVPNILGLLVDLAVADNKLFVIEEPENDIHPEALKALLKLIVDKSKSNQFIITTHSNIVTKYLGAEPGTKIFRVDMELQNNIPTSRTEEVSIPEAKGELLEYLGYEPTDLYLYDGFLFLEESSAEKIIKEYLFHWFAPSLVGKLKTYSAMGKDKIKVRFESFNTLFCYLNQEPVYKNKAWVIIDSGEDEKRIIDDLKHIYGANGWDEAHFQQFKEPDFERYYPAIFKEDVNQVLSMPHGKEKQNQKSALLAKVEAWIQENQEAAEDAFKESASEVIDKLETIASEL